jgi:hypothetical protein
MPVDAKTFLKETNRKERDTYDAQRKNDAVRWFFIL